MTIATRDSSHEANVAAAIALDDGRSRGLICLSAIGGTMGDVRPLVALGLALRARGFSILLVGDGAFRAATLRAGVRPSEWFTWSEVPQDFCLRTAAGQRRLWGQRSRYRDRLMWREIAKHRAVRTAIFWQRVGEPTSSHIVAAIGSMSAFGMLLDFGPQCAKVISCPMPYQPSRQFTLAPPDRSLLERVQDWRRARAVPAEVRRQFCEQTFHLVSVSPSIFPRPTDWGAHMQVTGYVDLDENAEWTPDAELADFLERGSPPVYVGFGSYPLLFGPRGKRLAETIIRGCRQAGVRCIIHSSDLDRTLGSEDVAILDGAVPHSWLFPRCAAVVHHGGYGTLHAALVARRPMVIYPHQTDQFLWSARMGALGVGPGFTARLRNLSSGLLANDLAFVTTPACLERARRLGRSVEQEQGLSTQVAAVESIIEHTRRGRRAMDWQMSESWGSLAGHDALASIGRSM